jgi:hypothetical protein
LRSEEKLIIGYAAGKPVALGILFVSGHSAGIFSLITQEDLRGKGYSADMI